MDVKEIRINKEFFISLNYINENNFSIFNQSKFLDLHKNKYIKNNSFALIEVKNNKCVAIFNISKISENQFSSPCIGSYGSFEFKENIQYYTKEIFVNKVLELVDPYRNSNIFITLPPEVYNFENNTQLISILYRCGFNIKNIETNQYFDLDDFDQKRHVSYNKNQRVKKSIDLGLSFKRFDKEEYQLAYNVILQNRIRRKFRISMSWDDINKMINKFHEKFYVFGTLYNEEIVASAICLEVVEKILYVFYWGDANGYDKLSPMAYLSSELIKYAKLHCFNILDIGTSSSQSLPNYGLYKFKRELGCKTCAKFILSRHPPLI